MSDKTLWNKYKQSAYKTVCRSAARISSVLHLDASVCVNQLQSFRIYSSYTIMADSNRIVFPDKVAEAKAKAVAEVAAEDKTSGGDSNTIDAVPKEVEVSVRSVITVPDNCPPGYKLAADGVCREVFD